MQKKVVFVFSTAYFPYVGGAEVAIKEITDRISEYDFILFTAKIKRGLPSEEKIGNVLVYRLGLGSSFDKFLLPVLAFIKFFQISYKLKAKNYLPTGQAGKLIMWGMMASYGSIAAYFIKLFKPKILFLLTLQEGDSEAHLKYGKLGLVGFFGKKIIKKADKIQVISNYLKDFAIRQGAKAEIFIVPNGVDFEKSNPERSGQNLKEKFQPKADPPLAEKNKLNIRLDEKVIITTSRLVHKNAIDVLIKAFHLLSFKFQVSSFKLLILGDGELKKELENLALKLDLKNEAIFLGFIKQEEIYDYLAVSDIFVRPSRSEGLGNSFLEAMAAGLPVIGTSVGGIPDFLIDNETGLFCRVDDPEDLAEKITMLFQDENLRRKIIENAKNLVESKYDWRNISKKMKELFNALQVETKTP